MPKIQSIQKVDVQYSDVQNWYLERLVPEKIDHNDQKVYENVYHDGKFPGIFQCSSRGAQKFFVDAKPRSIVDIAALTSIFRPGPLAGNVHTLWLKHETEPYDWGHPLVNKTLEKTRGCLVDSTMIELTNGEVKNVAKLVKENAVGTKILTFNEENKTFEEDEILAVLDSGIQDCLHIELEDGRFIELTNDHKLLTNNGWKRADELNLESDMILSLDVIRPCRVCGKELTGKKQSKYCCQTCASSGVNNSKKKHYFYQKECEFCHKEFNAYSANANTRFCSHECSSNWKSKTYSGRKITDEWKQRQNEGKKRERIIKYGNFKCEKCQKEFETNLQLRAHKSYCTNNDLADIQCEICGKSFKRERHLKFHMTLVHNEEKYKSFCANVKNGCSKRETQNTSNEEIDFFKRLKQIFPNVVHKFKIDGCAHEFDFYVPEQKLLIEFDGDYWHGNKKTQILTKQMKIQFNIDKANTQYARDNGYIVHRVWSSESYLYPQTMRNDI